MKKNLINVSLLLCLSFTLFNCKKNKDDAPTPQVPNEQEQITTLHLIVKESGILVDTFSFKDLDGPGGNVPTLEAINLSAGKTYSASLLLLDQSKMPADTISKDIEEEKNAHQFFYTVTTANLSVQYNDVDDHGVPLGLQTLMTTGAASTGSLKITLKHQPGLKPTAGSGDSSLGETDVEVVFDVNVVN